MEFEALAATQREAEMDANEVKEEPSEEEEELPCDEECDPLDIQPLSGDGARVVQSHLQERLNPEVVKSEVDAPQVFSDEIPAWNGLQPSVKEDIEISYEDEYLEKIDIKEEVEDLEEIEIKKETEKVGITTRRRDRRSSPSTHFHGAAPKTKKLKPHTQEMNQDIPEEGMAYKKQRPLPSQYSGSSSSGSSSSSDDDEAVEDQRPREVPPPKRPATKRKGKGKMMKPSSQGDLRGRKPCATRIPSDVTARAVQHIKSFPTVSSHYTRAKSPLMRYLEGTLNIKKMYRMYLLWMETHYPNETRVTSSFYRKTFRGFRLGFKPPMSDTCSKCDHFKVAISKETDEDRRQVIKNEKKEHLTKAKEGQRLMKMLSKDTDDNTCCICIDLQQTLPVPRLSTSVAYYQKKLWMYNLCIHDLKKNESQFFVWDEVNGGRGSAEIASCLFKWIENEFEKSEFKVLKIVSDNCGGQNKNINILLFYLREVHNGRLDQIDHYYLIPGHSYMACDRSFGNIEKTIRATGDVFDFRQYCLAIGGSRTVRQKVTVMRMSNFLHIDVLQNCVTVRRPQPPYKFQDARRFTVTKQYREGYYVAMEYDGPVGSVRLRKGTVVKNPMTFNLSQVDLPQKYTSPRRLKPGKVKALKYLLAYIPPAHNRYLQYIITQQEDLDNPQDEEDEEEVDDVDDNLDYDEDEEGGESGETAEDAVPTTSSQ